MMQSIVDLSAMNTFGVKANAEACFEIASEKEFMDVLALPSFSEKRKMVLGGGSNILFTRDFPGWILLNRIKGFELVKEDADNVWVRSGAGENWHLFVQHTIVNDWSGLENLSLIPGCVGASPIQNIGAYGVEMKDCFDSLEALDMTNGTKRVFSKEECAFGYRESIFKRELKERYFISRVTFKLKKHPVLQTTYGAIKDELAKAGVTEPGIREVSEAVIRIRQSKLPDPAVLGNAGSFFKNPEVNPEVYQRLKGQYPDISAYPLENGNVKLAAGWLIERAGWKGKRMGNAGVHSMQALVLVNYGGATGKDIYDISSAVLEDVFRQFGVQLEREVNVW